MRHGIDAFAGLFLAGLVASAALAGDPAATPQLADLSVMDVTTYDEVHHDDGVLTVELRDEEAITKAMFELPLLPDAIEVIPDQCTAVLITDETTDAQAVAAVAGRLEEADCTLFRLGGTARDWIAATLAGPAERREYTRPGEVPFVVPRGLCETLEPSQAFD